MASFVLDGNRVLRKVKIGENIVEVPFVPFVERADLVSKYHNGFGHAG